ncbi:hypothetical protein [Microbulbifer agarilyticus]|uniref:hypothetical protein n=1 Tax=Microbulbifer agarilyticus TaxID=260552 RepID=UPI001CD77BE1|nr:hypothetical protein [Microbulbifer agarilyticus]MCA0894028.1 hypothetical protein [Microbulbifer agarilyticus]
MSGAGNNEKQFIQLFDSKVGKGILNGKRSFKKTNVSISVDNSLHNGNSEILIEIDSGNMAKLLVGQYVLLNQLYTGLARNAHFLVVHTYNGYNVQRTLNNLALVKKLHKYDLSYSAMHINDMHNWGGGDVGQFLQLAST